MSQINLAKLAAAELNRFDYCCRYIALKSQLALINKEATALLLDLAQLLDLIRNVTTFVGVEHVVALLQLQRQLAYYCVTELGLFLRYCLTLELLCLDRGLRTIQPCSLCRHLYSLGFLLLLLLQL